LYFKETGWENVGWINLAQDKEQWRALLNKAMNLRVKKKKKKMLGAS
jgi:hypothetical protein